MKRNLNYCLVYGIIIMRWPVHLLKNYHDPSVQLFDFPLKFGTFGCPSSKYVIKKQPIYHRFLKTFGFSSADHSEFQTKYIQLVQYMEKNDPNLEKITKPELCLKIKNSLQKLRNMGYRMKVINRWENVLEWKLYGHVQYEGLSPFDHQNFAYDCYKIHQINLLHIPIRMEFQLNKNLLFSDKPGKELIKYENPFDIRNLPKESLHLHTMLEKFPVYILSVDAGILSKVKFQIIDLYSQSEIVEGEKSGDEYEFHLLRLEKVFPKDLKRYEKEIDYQRFMDVNFKHEQFNWTICDVDQYMGYLPISST